MKKNIQVKHKEYGKGRVVGIWDSGNVSVRFNAKTTVMLPKDELEIVRIRYFAPVVNAPSDTKLPVRKTRRSAAYDFFLPCDVVLEPHTTSKIIPTNVKAYMRTDEVLMLYVRSSVGIKRGVTLANGTGVIDSDYADNPDNDGNIGICLHNNSDTVVEFKKGECVMQGIFMKYMTTDDDEVTEERTGGFGSTGK